MTKIKYNFINSADRLLLSCFSLARLTLIKTLYWLRKPVFFNKSISGNLQRLLALLVLSHSVMAQAPKRDFLSEINLYKIQDKKLGEIQVGVFKGNSIDKEKPLLLILQGSGENPTFIYVKSANFVASMAFTTFQKYKDQYHVAYINKAGMPLFDSVATPKTRYPVSDFNKANRTLDWRAESASKAIDFLLKKLKVSPGKVYVAGHSEGAQVAPKVAVLNKKVTKLVMMNTHGHDHIYEQILVARQKAFAGQISQVEAQVITDSLYTVQKAIFENPNSLDKWWWGDNYKRWYSYLKEGPLDNMVKLSIPILFVASGKDESVAIASSDIAVIEFRKKQKTNLTYKVYPDHNHSHYQLTVGPDGKEIQEFKAEEVLADVFEWLKNNSKMQYMKFRSLLASMMIPLLASAQSDIQANLYKHFKVIKQKDTINYQVYAKGNIKDKRNFIVYFQGSGHLPLFGGGEYIDTIRTTQNGLKKIALMRTIYSVNTAPIDITKIPDDYALVLISKKGIPFFYKSDLKDFEFNPPKEFYRTESLDYRVWQGDEVIKDIRKKLIKGPAKVVVIGHSEGSDVAAKLATKNKSITHVGYWAGGGDTQYYDFALFISKAVQRGEISVEEGNDRINALLDQIKEIEADPNNIDKYWDGHSYQRWSTFTEPSINNLLKIKVPVFVAVGALDKSVPIESSYLIPIEFLRYKKTNLTFKVYPDYDHSFRKMPIDAKDKPESQFMKVFEEFINWVK